ncbi:MAG: hypothetical protein K6G71_09565 [Clostridiales bacterium]|nr:hypothetical protein [Clostridiales bacterium]
MTFGETLQKTVESEHISVSGLFKKTGIQRSLIYAVMRGDRRLTPENCGKLINSSCFPNAAVPGLFDSYLHSELEPEELEAWDVLLSGLRGEIADEATEQREYPAAGPVHEKRPVCYGKDEVIAAIGYALNKGTELLLSDFAFAGDIPSMVYGAYRSGSVGRVEHVVRFSGLTPAEKLRSLFMSVPFAEAGIDTKINELGGAAYDSFMLTDDFFIEYMDDLSQAAVYPADAAPRTLAEKVGAARTLTFRFGNIAESVLKNEYMDGAVGKNAWFGFTTSFPLVFASKENVISSLDPAFLKSAEAQTAANGLEEHFRVTTAGITGWHSLMTDSAVDDFFKSGTVKEAPKTLFPNGASVSARVDLAEPFLSAPGYTLTLIRSGIFGEVKQYLTANDSDIQFFGVSRDTTDKPEAFTDIRVILNDPKLSMLCRKLTEYFTNSYYCMSDDMGKLFISQRISVLKGMIGR